MNGQFCVFFLLENICRTIGRWIRGILPYTATVIFADTSSRFWIFVEICFSRCFGKTKMHCATCWLT